MMNNGYGQSDYVYTSRSSMCFDNKGMVTPTPSERACPPPVHVNIGTDTEKPPLQDSPPFRIWRKVKLPQAVNGFLALFVTVLLIITEYGYVPGTKMGYTCQDPSISHKYRGEVITPVMLGVGCVVLPLLVLVFTEILIKDSVKRMDISNLWFLYKECLIGGILVLVLTEMAKVIVGEHRPHFLDVCEPDTAVGCSPGSFIMEYKCTSTKYRGYFLVDSSRSFPSGHSSVSVFVGIFSAYIIHTRLPTSRTGYLLKPFLISICLTWALVCSLTRITDRRHHWWDVLAGVFLGVCGVAYTICLVQKKTRSYEEEPPTRISASTTTLLDVKNKDATSVII